MAHYVQNFTDHELEEQKDIEDDSFNFQNCHVEFAEELGLRQRHRKILSRIIIASLRGNMRVEFTIH
jgi:hypothetical protein